MKTKNIIILVITAVITAAAVIFGKQYMGKLTETVTKTVADSDSVE